MKTTALPRLALTLLVLALVPLELEAQRSRGGGGSRPAPSRSVSPSRSSVRPSTSRPSISRPSISRPSVSPQSSRPSVSRPSISSSRPSFSPSSSSSASSGTTVRPSTRPSGDSSARPYGGRSLYDGRSSLPSTSTSTTPNLPGSTGLDSARPTATSRPGSGPTVLGVGSSEASPSRSRVRFPTLYHGPSSTAGTAVRPDSDNASAPAGRPAGDRPGTSLAPDRSLDVRSATPDRYRTGLGRGIDMATPSRPGRGVVPEGRPGSGPAGGGKSVAAADRPSSAHAVRYDAGPVIRTKRPFGTEGRPGNAPGTRPTPGGVQPTRPSTSAGGGPAPRPLTSVDVKTTSQVLSKLDPKDARRIRVQGQIAGAASSVALGASLTALGGVRPSTYGRPRGGGGVAGSGYWGSGLAGSGYLGYGGYGGYGYYGNPFGCYGYDGGWGFSFGYGNWFGGYYNPCSWTWWPYYVSCYAPYWYLRYWPSYCFRYGFGWPGFYSTAFYSGGYYGGATSTTTTNVVYVSSEPVGEAQAERPLNSVAQRYLTLGDRAFREARYTDAVQFYAKAVEYAPDEGALYLVLSDALFAAGDYHYGAYALRRAVELEAELVSVPIDKHGFYGEPGMFDEQLARLEAYVAQHATDRDARLMLAMNYHFGGRPADAVRLLEDPASATLADDVAAVAILTGARAAVGR